MRINTVLSAPDTNPAVQPVKPFEHSAFWSLALLAAEWAQGQLGLWKDAPQWVTFALVALPWVIRLIRRKTYKAVAQEPDAVVIRPPPGGGL